jgi:hypothetical protein
MDAAATPCQCGGVGAELDLLERSYHLLAEFQRFGARPAAAIVGRRLREHGVRDVPVSARGPRPSVTRPG